MDISAYLNIKTPYSLLKSLVHFDKLITLAKESGYKTLGICDYDVLCAVPYFTKICQENDIKAVIGMQFKVKYNDEWLDIICYIKNIEGYLNLNKISTYINSENYYLNFNELDKYLNGLVLTIIFDNSLLSKYVLNDENELLKNVFNDFKNHFSRFFIAVTDGSSLFNQNLYKKLELQARINDVDIVALDRVNYLLKEDEKAFNILNKMQLKTTIDDKRVQEETNLYFKNKDELESIYSSKSLSNLQLLSTLCNFSYNQAVTELPKYVNEKNIDSASYLIALCKTGLKLRLKGNIPLNYNQRLKDELSVILKMKFENYFLIVYDFVKFAKKNNILVGPGRGSAAGSLVSYVLGITDIDPIKYNLLFERFLNPERITMPDIDIDFQDNRRQEVIDYVVQKYGKENVAHILTFGTLKAKQVIRDVGKILLISNQEIDRISKTIPNIVNMNLTKAYNEIKAFKELINAKKETRELFDICLKLEGLPRHYSMHAAGVVMSLKKLSDVVALIKLEEGALTTQFQMDSLEKIGLIKMDFLGLKNLSTIQEICDEIKKTDNTFSLNKLALNDQKTFELIKAVKTLGVFQLESSGMMALIRKMKPKNFNEIAITIALFRPGPMQNIDLYLENRSNSDNINYLHKDLIEILKETSGIIIYQEQIMQIAQKLAGFSLSKADILRKAMSKKNRLELEKLEEEFILGCINNFYSEKLAKEIYELILRFADYGFNKSHSIAYALIAYQMAYLKANYPLYFYRSLLNSSIGSEIKTYEYIQECQNSGVIIKMPHINKSSNDYLIENNELLMPLTIIKNVGINTVKLIVANRQNKGEFQDYIDAVCRLNNIGCSSRVITSLIDAGAFDCFNYNRETMNYNLNNVLKYAEIGYSDSESILDESIRPSIALIKEKLNLKAEKEKDVLGFYFSINPIKQMKKILNISTRTFNEIKSFFGLVNGFGIITKIKPYRTKNGEWMAFLLISDDTSSIDLVLMPRIYNKISNQLIVGKYVYFEGKIEKESSVLINRIEVYNE